jgi:NADH dehydrogenase subunit E (EC 1.6.5.3)
LGIQPGETTSDLEFTFETVNCLGACALGPILVVDAEYHGQMTISKANKILKKLGKKVESDDE